MNKRFLVNIVGCLLFLVLSSCRDDGVNGKLLGKWQLKTVEHSGDITRVDTVWYNFQSESLFMYQIYWADKDTFIHWYGFKVQPEEYTMELELVYNLEIPTSEFLPHTDWITDKRTFTVEHISGKRLTLRSDEKIYSFTKFE